jgi:uncharacterized MAPEG superfamily protein
MKPELVYLVWVTVFTALIWLPYVLDVGPWGLADTVGYPESPSRRHLGRRKKSAHTERVENLVVFATLVLVANAAGISNSATVLACSVYFWARVVHLFAYTFALPWIRTLGFAAGFACQLTLAWQLLSR